MADTKTDSYSTPLSDDPVNPTKGGLSAKPNTASQPAGAEPGLDTLFHRTDMRVSTGPSRTVLLKNLRLSASASARSMNTWRSSGPTFRSNRVSLIRPA